MSFAVLDSGFSETQHPLNHEITSIKEDERLTTSLYLRTSRYVNERMKRQKQYKSVLVSLKPIDPIKEFVTLPDDVLFAKIHVPQFHILSKTNYSFTLEDLLHRLNSMKIKYPLCVYCHENHPCARLNYQQTMSGNYDGRDYLTLLFVAQDEIKSYQKRWPNQILVELPFESVGENWKDLFRQSIKVFCQTVGVQYAFLLEDNIYTVLKQNQTGFSPASLFEYLTFLQDSATQSKAPLLGSRVINIGEIPSQNHSDWENKVVQNCILLQIEGNDHYLKNGENLVAYENRLNSVSPVQQAQQYVIMSGYTLDDPISEKRKPQFRQVSSLEPEMSGFNLRVKVVSKEVAVDEVLSDGTRWARGLFVIADESSSVVFIAIDEQVDKMEVGKCYHILNAKVVMYKGWVRVEVDEWGNVAPSSDDVNSNASKNISTIEYELVDSQDE